MLWIPALLRLLIGRLWSRVGICVFWLGRALAETSAVIFVCCHFEEFFAIATIFWESRKLCCALVVLLDRALFCGVFSLQCSLIFFLDSLLRKTRKDRDSNRSREAEKRAQCQACDAVVVTVYIFAVPHFKADEAEPSIQIDCGAISPLPTFYPSN